MIKHYERRLPHWDTVGEPLFVTFRLYGSLPASRVFPPAKVSSGKAFVAMDRLLDTATTGPFYLRQPQIARLVVNALQEGAQRLYRYELHSFVVMPNHVHMLVTPHVVATKWLGPLKGFTAHEANMIMRRSGQHFWQDESYDHLVRSGVEFRRIQGYIENNPVSAGFVAVAEDFLWSSARKNAG